MVHQISTKRTRSRFGFLGQGDPDRLFSVPCDPKTHKDTPTQLSFWDFPAGLVANSAAPGFAPAGAHGSAYGCERVGPHGFALA